MLIMAQVTNNKTFVTNQIKYVRGAYVLCMGDAPAETVLKDSVDSLVDHWVKEAKADHNLRVILKRYRHNK